MRFMGTRTTALVTAVALLASAALAQDQPGGPPLAAPPAPAEAPPEIPPYVIRLPEVAGHAARAGGVPTVLVAIDGFLAATTDPFDAFRVHGGRLLRTRDGADAIVGLRLGVVPGRGTVSTDATMTDADARNLLALDIDAERADCAKWLSRIDPVRCAVRIRLGAAAVPTVPETLQLVEFVADGTRRGPEALPALAQARRIALYDFDFSNAPDSVRGAAIDERREARFREAHAGAIVVTSPRPAFDEVIAGCDLVRVRTGGLRPRVIDLFQGAAVKAFVADLEFLDLMGFQTPSQVAVPPTARCELEFVRAGRPVVRFELVPEEWFDRLEWASGPWHGAMTLRRSSGTGVRRRLRDLGVHGPLEYVLRLFGDRAAPQLRDQRQSQLLGDDVTRRLRAADADRDAADTLAALRDPAVACRVLGCSRGFCDDPVSVAAKTALGECTRDVVLGAAAANLDDAELQLGFALWMWGLPDRDFLTAEQKPLLERTARLLASDVDTTVLALAVRPCRELQLVEPLRRILSWGRFDTVLPYPSQIAAAAALVDLGDAESLPNIRKLRDASEDAEATAALDAVLERAAAPAPK